MKYENKSLWKIHSSNTIKVRGKGMKIVKNKMTKNLEIVYGNNRYDLWDALQDITSGEYAESIGCSLWFNGCIYIYSTRI